MGKRLPERKNGYEVSGTDLNDLLDMIDNGQINEAENLMLDDIDYSDKKGLAAEKNAQF